MIRRRKIKEELGDGDINEFTYDAAGRMLTAVNAHSSVTFTYDAAGRLASTSQPAGDVSYAYNAANQTISRTDSANAVTYEYDTAGRMVQLGSSAFGAFGFEHDAASRMNRVLYPNGVDLDLKRDGRGRITEIAFTRSGVYLDGEMRRLDAVGNTTTRERSGEDELRFGYDTLDQLLQVSAGMSVQEVYAYDSVGNWSVDGRSHDACNRLIRDETRTFDYDRDGNLTEIHDSDGDGSASYEYDALGRLVGATLSTGETITYRYDAIGRRYAVSTSAGTTFTLFDGWQEIGTVEPDGSSRSMLAVGEFRLAADTASGPMYVHAGLEGSVIALTNVLGELVERYRYTAFGLLTVLDADGEEKDSPALSPWLYHGRLYENESGLYWMRMRHYSPDLGRFLQPDPAGIAGGINLYAYSNNNPLRFFDPWGLWPPNTAAGDNDGEHGEADPQNEKKKKGRKVTNPHSDIDPSKPGAWENVNPRMGGVKDNDTLNQNDYFEERWPGWLSEMLNRAELAAKAKMSGVESDIGNNVFVGYREGNSSVFGDSGMTWFEANWSTGTFMFNIDGISVNGNGDWSVRLQIIDRLGYDSGDWQYSLPPLRHAAPTKTVTRATWIIESSDE